MSSKSNWSMTKETDKSSSTSAKYYSETRVIKLKTHPRNFCEEDLVVNMDSFAKDKFRLWEGLVIEIFPVDERKSTERRNHLLLEVRTVPPDVQAKGGPLSISQEVAQAFNLNGLREVAIRRVDKEEVALDLVEVKFKDQGLSRSDMWRFTSFLIDKGMYMSRKLFFAGMFLKVNGLWAKGDTVKSGVVVDTTRIVFRSASSRFFLFLQIGSEIWQFDPNGDVYFDKAVDGFLKDLFSLWKEKECNHQLTLIFFARKYSKSKYTSDGVKLLQDKCGRYYQDFYNVVIENECRSDWSSAIVEVKKCFQKFQLMLRPSDSFITEEGSAVFEEETEWISTSAEGNILEATNLAVNVLENEYKDCSFHTTGQQIVVVSPGAGVFEVDIELNRLTKERIIDHGIGMDLVCLNEQPLHAVPLFKFHEGILRNEHYHIPHWINYSYYNPSRPWTRFKPRVKISDHLINKHVKAMIASYGGPQTCTRGKLITRTDMLSLIDSSKDLFEHTDYDKYDANIFVPSIYTKSKSLSDDDMTDGPAKYSSEPEEFEMKSPLEPWVSPAVNAAREIAITKKRPRARYHSDNYEDQSPDDVMKVGSAEPLDLLINRRLARPPKQPRSRKAFINPFDPSKSHVEANSHHCRWMHTFPRDCSGRAFQTHHVNDTLERLEEYNELNTIRYSRSRGSTPLSDTSPQRTDGTFYTLAKPFENPQPRAKTIVENFATVRRAGMDWTSLTEPACLPLTTDYYPDDSAISRDYLDYPSSLVATNYDNRNVSMSDGWRADHQNLKTSEAFKEMISQRLAQGFQLVFHYGSLFSLHKDLTGLDNAKKKHRKIDVKFSLGQVFQTISLIYPDMSMHIYKLKAPLVLKPFSYKYRIVSSNGSSHIASCTIKHQRREEYNWNYLDQHICGYSDFEEYQESHKYWRCRFLLLPSTPPPADRSGSVMNKWLVEVTNGFVRIAELMNHIKRTSQSLLTDKKREFVRRKSLPAQSPTPPFSSLQVYNTTSPTPTRSKSKDEFRSHSVTPGPYRSVTDPHSSRGLSSEYQGGLQRTRSRDDISTSPFPRRARSPQLTGGSMRRRNHQEIVKDLKELTLGATGKQSVSPSPQRQRWGYSNENLQESLHEEEDVEREGFPSLRIVPSTPTGPPPDDDQSPLDYPESMLTVDSPHDKILSALLNIEDGVDLLVNQPLLRNNCFISMEAIKWLQERLAGNLSRKEVTKLMQKMVSNGLILHASGNRDVPFRDGYYFYYAPGSDSSEDKRKIDDWEKKWFEVGINEVDLSSQEWERSTTSSRASSYQNSPYYMHMEGHESRKVSSDRSSRFVELNPDSQSISDRPEWCYVHYKDTYYQTEAYPMEYQWMACTISLLHKLIQTFTHKAAMCGFNLVPVHSLGTLGLVDNTNDAPYPFLQPLFIPMELSTEHKTLLEDSNEDHSDFTVQLFQTVIDKLEFLLEPSSVTEFDIPSNTLKPNLCAFLTRVFIHHSGTALVQPVFETNQDKPLVCGFKWLANSYYLRQRSTVQSVLNKYEELTDTFTAFCSNTKELSDLCNRLMVNNS